MTRELLQQALDALLHSDSPSQKRTDAIAALRSAIAAPPAAPIDGFGGNLDSAFDAPVSGSTDGLSQDYNGKLGRWFADRLGAREQLRRDMPPAAPADMVIVPREILMRALELLSCIGCSPEGAEHDVRDAAKLQEDIKPFIAAAPAPAVPPPIDNRFVAPGCEQFGTRADAESLLAMLRTTLDEYMRLAAPAPVVPLTDDMVESEFVNRGDDKAQGLHPYWKDAFREGFNFARSQLSAAPAAPVPLTDDQIDEIWDGSFDSADPKRQLSFRQIITRAIEAHHGIGGSNG